MTPDHTFKLPLVLTLRQVADLMGLTFRQVQRMADAGTLKTVRLTGKAHGERKVALHDLFEVFPGAKAALDERIECIARDMRANPHNYDADDGPDPVQPAVQVSAREYLRR